MFKKILIVLMIGCFLLGMATRAEAENVEETVNNSNTTEKWTQEEIEYFQEKEYVGDSIVYTESDLTPPYIENQAGKEEILKYLRLLRNEIFARKGYDFNSEDLKEFFGRMAWYESLSQDVTLNGQEKENVSLIKSKEEKINKIDESDRNKENLGEEYKKKTILKGKFYMHVRDQKNNSKPTEFAMMMWEGEPEFPSGFTISEDGKKLYLLDTFNERLQIFSAEDGRLLRSVKVETFEMADSNQIEESKESWNTMGFAFSILEANSLFWDKAGNVIVAGKERVSLSQRGKKAYKPICYGIDTSDYSVSDLSKKVRFLERFPDKSSRKMKKLKKGKVKFPENEGEFEVFLSKEDDRKKIIIDKGDSKENIETEIEVLGKARIYMGENKNLTIVDKQIDKNSFRNLKWVLSIYNISSQNGEILKRSKTKVDYYSSRLCLDEKGNIYYWERIPNPKIPHSYHTSKWQVVKLQGVGN